LHRLNIDDASMTSIDTGFAVDEYVARAAFAYLASLLDGGHAIVIAEKVCE
jgi:hypothetical protein